MSQPLRLDSPLLRATEWLQSINCELRVSEARVAEFSPLPIGLHHRLKERLELLGLHDLYCHQTEAFELSRRGGDVMVVTGTNSGKTLCYNLAVMQACLTEPACRSLYIMPTKALAQDQLRKLEALTQGLGIYCGAFDGDTPRAQRSAIRKNAHVIVTNPDMLHLGILGSFEGWQQMLKSLRYIVIDEMHTYRGVFGSHVASVIRRLIRLAEWYGSRPQIIGCSATIGNPAELFQKLTGRTPGIINHDGSPQGPRVHAFYCPNTSTRASNLSTNVFAGEALARMCSLGMKALAFSRSRLGAELVVKSAKKQVSEFGNLKEERLECYRGGYTAKERRQIEKAFSSEKLVGLSSTNALELGIDIGDLDCVILNGYPGTLASYRQQTGRAGRDQRPGISLFIAHDDPLEYFLASEPDRLLNEQNENVAVDPLNSQILSEQLVCAAQERPLTRQDLDKYWPGSLALVDQLDQSGELVFRGGFYYYPAHNSPQARVNLRSMAGESIKLMCGDLEVGEMERWRAISTAYKGAIYIHRGPTYQVSDLDLDGRVACLVPFESQTFTQSVIQSNLTVTTVLKKSPIVDNIKISLCSLNAVDSVLGFVSKTFDHSEISAVQSLELPDLTYDTIGIRIDLGSSWTDSEDSLAAIHGAEHALLAAAPAIAVCDRTDLGSAWYAILPDTMTPALFVFDRAPGGIGLSESLFEQFEDWVKLATGILSRCACTNGCPRCLYSTRCEAGNKILSKHGAIVCLRTLSTSE